MIETLMALTDIERQHEVTIQVGQQATLTYMLYHITKPEEIYAVCDWFDAQTIVGVDTETSGLDPFKDKLATLQLGNPFIDHPTAFVIDLRLFTQEQLQPILDRIADDKVIKLGQNVKFEYKFLCQQMGCDIKNMWDTQIAEMSIRAGLFPEGNREEEDGEGRGKAYSHSSMAALCQRYMGISIDKDKDLRMSFYVTPGGTYSLRQLVYAASDVIYPFYIKQEQEQEIDARAIRSVIGIEMATIRIVARAELRGMRLDVGQWRALSQEAEQRCVNAERKLHTLLRGIQQQELFDSTVRDTVLYPNDGSRLNFDSPKQVQWAIKSYCESINWPIRIITTKKERTLLRKQYGAEWLDWRFKNQRGKKKTYVEFLSDIMDMVPDHLIPDNQYCLLVSTDKDTLKLAEIKKQLPKELIELLLEYSQQSILRDTFGNDFITKYVREDGKIHTEFHQNKTSTGRTSSSPNLQNIPKDYRYRKCFIPSEGYKFIVVDYSQQEPRLSAQESMDPVYLRTYQNDEDLYVNLCEVMLGYRPDKNSPDPEFREKSKRDRDIMKQVVLAMAYRMGPAKLYRKLLLALAKPIIEGAIEAPTYEYVRGLHEQFLKTFPKLVDYQNYCSTNASHDDTTRPRIWDRYINGPVTWATARCGRKRFFAEDYEGVYTAASNSPIQGCAATMTKAAAVLIQKYSDKHNIDAYVVDLVHDELVYECRADQAEEFAKVVQHLMIKAGKFYLPDVPIKAEFPENSNGVLDYWAKEIKI